MTNLHGAGAAIEELAQGLPSRLLVMKRRLGFLLVRQGRMAARDLRNIPRYVLRTLIGVTIACGLLSLWESRGDGKIPSMSLLNGFDPYRISSAGCVAEGTDAETRWKGLSSALAILDSVNPAVATWVREKHEGGAVVFCDDYRAKGEPTAAQAKYDMFRGRLVVNRHLFCENDGTIAVILCHEYRHSRQNVGKVGKYALSCLFVSEGDLSIIENDAMIYEQEAHRAIFENGESRQKEVAAWEHWAQLQYQSGKH